MGTPAQDPADVDYEAHTDELHLRCRRWMVHVWSDGESGEEEGGKTTHDLAEVYVD